jgi:hypothetical protein
MQCESKECAFESIRETGGDKTDAAPDAPFHYGNFIRL